MSVLICPVCQGKMKEISKNGVLIDTCVQCRGVWLDRGELEKLSSLVGGSERSGGFFGGKLAGHRYDGDDDDDDHRDRARQSGVRGQPQKSRRSSLLDFFD